MINSLIIENFQSHKDTVLEFSPGVNILAGESDTGKTSVVRALLWVLTNRPKGESFVRENSNVCTVTVVCDGTELINLSRKKNKANTYSICGYTDVVPEEIVGSDVSTWPSSQCLRL